MKKILLVLFAICVMSLLSCSEGVEEQAKMQMEKSIKYLAKDPDIKISDTKTIFKNDSLVVLQCVTRGLNGFGGYTRSDVEYIYRIENGGKREESIVNLEESESVIDISKKMQETNPSNNPNTEARDSAYIVLNATLRLAFSGHEVKE